MTYFDKINGMKKQELINKLNFWSGYFKGASNTLRSAGDIDPLALSGDFEDIKRDLGIILCGINELVPDEVEESGKKEKEIGKK